MMPPLSLPCCSPLAKHGSAIRRAACGAAAGLLLFAAVWFSATAADSVPSEAHPPGSGEVIIHRRPERETAGKPAQADPNNSVELELTVLDAATGSPCFCRVNVIGADGNYYEPAQNTLAPWSLQRLGNRVNKGPFRYYGWFFYCDGTCVMQVPPGATRIEVWKGLEYTPVTASVNMARNQAAAVKLTLQRQTDMAARGWYSGDTHIHLNRRTAEEDERALDLAAAEDIRFAHILCMNDPRFYKPTMDQQIWHQTRGMGQASERYRGPYGISSGQEYRCGTFGHICLVGGSRLVDGDGPDTNPNNWPVFGLVAEQTHDLGGLAIHAHGGYSKEIYADFAQQATDGVELLQFAVYRGIGLEGWYHMLNAGYHFPAIGASDYPYCRALGDCRTYAYCGQQGADFSAWNRAIQQGRCFMTTGPLVELSVNGQLPGDTLALPAGGGKVRITARVESPTAEVSELLLLAGGEVVARKELPPEAAREKAVTWTVDLPVKQGTWLALRARSTGPGGRENVEAHTNPLWITVGGKGQVNQASVRWLLARLEERIAFHTARDFPQKAKVLAWFEQSRKVLLGQLVEGDPGS